MKINYIIYTTLITTPKGHSNLQFDRLDILYYKKYNTTHYQK